MAIIVEDGSGVANAESYATVAFCTQYHADRNNAGWAAIASDTLREGYLRQAMGFLLSTYRAKWKGSRVTSTQALDWPRSGVEITDEAFWQPSFYVAVDVIPLEVKYAVAELALFAADGPLDPNLKQNQLRKKVGPIDIEYDPYSPQSARYPIVSGYLRPFVHANGNAGTMRLTRT